MAAEHRVSSAADIARAAGVMQPGDALIMADGTWQDQAIVFRGQGTAAKPMTLRAATPGKVVLAGSSSVTIDGEHLAVCGLFLQDVKAAGDGVKLVGWHCRLTETAVRGGSYKFCVHLFGASNRFDHCDLAGKTNEAPAHPIEVEGTPNHHRIDHHHFGPVPRSDATAAQRFAWATAVSCSHQGDLQIVVHWPIR